MVLHLLRDRVQDRDRDQDLVQDQAQDPQPIIKKSMI